MVISYNAQVQSISHSLRTWEEYNKEVLEEI